MSRIRLALFKDRAHAESISDRLAEAGITAEVHDELGLAKLWFISRRSAGARVEVRSDKAENAERLLLEWSASRQVDGAILCPECGSFHIAFPQFTQKSVLTNLAIGLIAELGLVEREYYCEACHCMWEHGTPRRRRQRAHLAPNYFIEHTELDRPRRRSPHA